MATTPSGGTNNREALLNALDRLVADSTSSARPGLVLALGARIGQLGAGAVTPSPGRAWAELE